MTIIDRRFTLLLIICNTTNMKVFRCLRVNRIAVTQKTNVTSAGEAEQFEVSLRSSVEHVRNLTVNNMYYIW